MWTDGLSSLEMTKLHTGGKHRPAALWLLTIPHIIASTKGTHKLSRDVFSKDQQIRASDQDAKEYQLESQEPTNQHQKKIPIQKSQWWYVLRTGILRYLVLNKYSLGKHYTTDDIFPPTRQPMDKHFWFRTTTMEPEQTLTKRPPLRIMSIKEEQAKPFQDCASGFPSENAQG